MSKIPPPLNTIQALIDKHHQAIAEPPRGHMGASLLGDPCDRKLWLQFRWAVAEEFEGRILRLFRRGQNEEQIVIADLRAIGCNITATGAEQSRVNFGSHVGGSIDGIIHSGVPGAEKKTHVLEIKTHGQKSFDQLLKDGVQKSKPLHYTQMQIYMYGLGIDRALYFAVNKNDDSIYTERLHLDKPFAERAVQRGQRIALSERLPEPLSADPTWYQCKWCAAHSFCHKQEPIEKVNCRTCFYADPQPDDTWNCDFSTGYAGLSIELQREGCPEYIRHPDLGPISEKIPVWP